MSETLASSPPPYDPNARRETPLAAKLRATLAERPMPVDRFMAACLYDSEHGYYRRRPAIGADADFITAPEISQTFGDLIGLWSAAVWQQMGAPSRFNLIELGPGRGTMLADALRAIARVPGCLDAADILLVEPNAHLRTVQAETLKAHSYSYLNGDPPAAPTILIANEVLDCLPIRQFVRAREDNTQAAWRERVVRLDEHGRLVFGVGEPVGMRSGADIPAIANAPDGAILEYRNAGSIAQMLARLAAAAPVCALFIDYGHGETHLGDTLQAVRGHRAEHPLTSPGEADLTAQVDFSTCAAAIRDAAEETGASLAIAPLTTQSEFLGSLGIIERASRLMSANPGKAAGIEAGVMRLIAPNGMGTRFKVLGVRSAGLAPLPGFPVR